ncbi:hypothetical protein DSO57_1009740 [Entomophthora muscae]|uniref:Uncharacterized protein n=1 Tax=Entomophthora muscae TaxID=34485 RepID=A0ACC2USJ9_9FUNG|nr:hypothetical protein DSO57_1009740 [Entomophthora muscae]
MAVNLSRLFVEPLLLKKYFQQFGKVTYVLPQKKFSQARGAFGYYCYIKFLDGELAIDQVIKYAKYNDQPHVICGKRLDVNKSIDTFEPPTLNSHPKFQ